MKTHTVARHHSRPSFAAAVGLITLLGPTVPSPAADPALDQPLVQIALLLDTSNSMDGLIAQAKTQLWTVVNEFMGARHSGAAPKVEVALYEYGNNRLAADKNWVRQALPFTNDLDAISRELFALTTGGGSEYCGAVIQRAVEDLKWSESPKTYRAVFIAGNEPFTQGPVDSEKSSLQAFRKGIVVNPVHCGSEAEGRTGAWNRGAEMADGKMLVIDQNRVIAAIDAPQDADLKKLNTDLNATYLPYGKLGHIGVQNQLAQDDNAWNSAGNVAGQNRSVCKAGTSYCNSGWDAVDAVTMGSLDITAVPAADLPAAMRTLKPEERLAYVKQKETERKAIQEKILKLAKEREAFLAAKQKDFAAGTLQSAAREAIREQAKKAGFVWAD